MSWRGVRKEFLRSCLIELIEFVFYSRPHASDKKSLFAKRERETERGRGINDEGWSERVSKKENMF